MLACTHTAIVVHDRNDRITAWRVVGWTLLVTSIALALGLINHPPMPLTQALAIKIAAALMGLAVFHLLRTKHRLCCRIDSRGVAVRRSGRRRHMRWEAIEAVYLGGDVLLLRSGETTIGIARAEFNRDDWRFLYDSLRELLGPEFSQEPTDAELRQARMANWRWWRKALDRLLCVGLALLIFGLMPLTLLLQHVYGNGAAIVVAAAVVAIEFAVLNRYANSRKCWQDQQWRRRDRAGAISACAFIPAVPREPAGPRAEFQTAGMPAIAP